MEPLTAEEQRLVAEAATYTAKVKHLRAEWKASGRRLAKLKKKAHHARTLALYLTYYPNYCWWNPFNIFTMDAERWSRCYFATE